MIGRLGRYPEVWQPILSPFLPELAEGEDPVVIDPETSALVVTLDAYHATISNLQKAEQGCYLSWLSACDVEGVSLRIALRSSDGTAVLLKVDLGSEAELDQVVVPTVSDLFAGAVWHEREAWDMWGIHFEGNPDLRRILLPQEWEGFPLRKSYAIDAPCEPYRPVPPEPEPEPEPKTDSAKKPEGQAEKKAEVKESAKAETVAKEGEADS